MQRRSTVLGVALLIVLGALVGAIPSARQASAAQQQGSLAPSALSLSTVPSKLPADNNTYASVIVTVVDKNGRPTAALGDIQVFLVSSQESVGKVSPMVDVPTGQTYAIANFTTTHTSGQTAVTATSNGLEAGSVTVTTVVAVGYPTHVVITLVPDTVPARPANSGKLILELEDDVGLPAKAISDTSVSLYSSNAKIVNVSVPSITVKQGEYLREVNYTSSFVPGAAQITASATGFDSSVATLTVLGFPPLAVKVVAQPSQMITCSGTASSCDAPCTSSSDSCGRLVVALTDLNGNPTRALHDIQVQIRSSNLGVVDANETTVIKAGNISAIATFTTTPTAGMATITASAPNLQTGFATVTTTPPSLISPSACTPAVVQNPCSLVVLAGPNPVLADNRSYSSVVVSLFSSGSAGSTAGPAINMTGPTLVTLTSSITGVGNFTRIVFTIPEGRNWAAVAFGSTFQVGSTQLTASAQNLVAAQAQLTTFGPVPSKVVVKTISNTLPADGASHPSIELLLEDAFGSPVVAQSSPVNINLSSSQSELVKIDPTVTIPVNQYFTVVNVTTGILQGTATVTAITKLNESNPASAYTLSSATVSATIPAPSALGVFLPNGNKVMTSAGANGLPLMAVQLQDAGGNPARARAALNITMTSSNSTIFPSALTVPIDVGQDFASIPIAPAVPGTTTLTFSAPGLRVATLSVTFLPYPDEETISGGPATIFTNQTSIISVSVVIDGTPIQGVPVHWSTSNGGLIIATPAATNSSSSTTAANTTSSASSSAKPAPLPAGTATADDTTGSGGASIAILKPAKAGTAVVTAEVAPNGLPPKHLNFTVQVTTAPVVTKAKPSLIQQLTTFPLLLVPVGAVAGAGAVAFLLVRRRRAHGSNEEEFDSSLE